MRNIVKNLKPYWRTVLIIMFFLLVEALSDLMLPEYTSNIIDVGIQNGGIEHIIPEQITTEDFTKAETFMTEQERSSWENLYEKTGNLYERRELNKEALEKADDELLLPIVRAYQLENLSKEELQAMLDTIGDSTLISMGIAFAGECDAKAGMDMDAIRSAYLWKSGAKMLFMTLLNCAVAVCAGYFSSRTGASVGRDLRRKVYHNVIGFSNAEIDKFSTASLITRSTNDVQQVQMVSTMGLRLVLFAPIMGLGSLYKVLNAKADMAWIVGAGVGAVFIVIIFLMVVAMPKFKIMQDLVDRLNLVSREILTGMSVIRAFGREKEEEKRFDVANQDLKKTQLFVNRAMVFMMPGMMLIMYLMILSITWVSAKKIDAGTMQVGAMTAFISYSMQVVTSFLVVTVMSIIIPRAAVAANRIEEIVSSKSSIENPEKILKIEDENSGIDPAELEFHNVHFRYPGAEHDVLSDISFKAEPGKTTAIIGSTGSGKSTLINLIPRFYDVTEGKITLGGVDIRDLEIKDLRSRLGLAPQKAILFSGTIESNIKFGKSDASQEVVRESAEIAQAEEFIMEKEEGYQSFISQGGSNVSGGQKQRLAIARVIAKNPYVYLFDDSFSALDMKTDAALRRELEKKTGNASVIIVTQRVSTIINADNILVLDDGKLVGQGTHEELLKSCEVYMQIAMSQLSAKELGIEGA